jgi:hypothetical protein
MKLRIPESPRETNKNFEIKYIKLCIFSLFLTPNPLSLNRNLRYHKLFQLIFKKFRKFSDFYVFRAKKLNLFLRRLVLRTDP